MRTVGLVAGMVLGGLAIIAALAFFVWALIPAATADAYTPGYWQSWCIVVLLGVFGTCARPWRFKS